MSAWAMRHTMRCVRVGGRINVGAGGCVQITESISSKPTHSSRGPQPAAPSPPSQVKAKEARIRALAADPRIYERLVASIAPNVWEMDDIKKGLMVQLFGGSCKNFPGGRIRGEINLLLVRGGEGERQVLLLTSCMLHPPCPTLYSNSHFHTPAGRRPLSFQVTAAQLRACTRSPRHLHQRQGLQCSGTHRLRHQGEAGWGGGGLGRH